MKGVTPKQVPELRAHMVDWCGTSGSMGAATMLAFLFGNVEEGDTVGQATPTEMDARIGSALAKRTGASLSVAELYHVTKGKMPEVLEAAKEIPQNMQVQRHWFHVDHGFMAFENGYTTRAYYPDEGSINFGSNSGDNIIGSRNQTQIYGISWSITGETIRVLAWTDAQHFLRLAASEHFQDFAKKEGLTDRRALMRMVSSRVAETSPLIVAGQYMVKLDKYLSHAKAEHRAALRILLSACLMLKQYTTAASIVHTPRSSLSFINRINPHLGKQVTVIDKREIKANSGNAEVERDAPKRQLSVRFERRGHWREYKHEKWSEELREHPIWIPAHWMGHEGLPLATTTKVTRLKR